VIRRPISSDHLHGVVVDSQPTGLGGGNLMTADQAGHLAQPQVLGERITIDLIPAVADDLRRLQELTNLSKTDLANRAITSYGFLEAQLQTGHDVIVRDRRTGKTQLVRFL
jgi:hypothetical protein